MLSLTSQAAVMAALGAGCSMVGANNKMTTARGGRVIGKPIAANVGERVLADGGNAVDAAIAAALAACVIYPAHCGIGGYGGHLTLALAGGRRVISIDFNSMAPATAREDLYPLDANGEVRGQVNSHGWQAVGVPGTLAGFQLALDRYGTRSFRELAQPAIRYARDGFKIPPGQAAINPNALPQLQKDPGSARLYLPDGAPLAAGQTARNPELATLLATLAERNSVNSFYRGDIAHRIADDIQRNGGLVTARDMAAYQAREVRPLELKWNGFTVFTAPLTAGGLTVLEALGFLKALGWEILPAGPEASHAHLEASRVAWQDRLLRLGDPEKASVPAEKLLSPEYAREVAKRIEAAVKAKQPLVTPVNQHVEDGTANLSSVDRHGNMVAITFTHGGAFGAQVTVDGLGLTLGHGMSRFNPRPGHPNSPGPHKRPMNNMCPTVVLRDGKPVLAVGGAGGVKIPNTIFDILTEFVALGRSMEEAIAVPRMHCPGTLDVTMEHAWPATQWDYLQQIGFKVQAGRGAFASAVSFDPKTGACHAMVR